MDTTTAPANSPAILQSVPIDQLHPNPWNRTVFDPDAMKDLVASIKAVGVKERLIVRPLSEGGFQIASGHRRWMAAKEAGLTEVPCEVQPLSDDQVAEDNITINIQREDLPPLDLGRMLFNYMKQCSKTQKEVAGIFGKTEGWVSQYLGFLSLDPDLKNFTAVKFSMSDLRALKQLSLDQQQRVAQELKSGSLMPEKLQRRCQELAGGKKQPKNPKSNASATPDPLADIWPLLQAQAMATGQLWGVGYGPQELPGTKTSMPAWHFWIPGGGMTPKADVARWFRWMADALAGAAAPPTDAAAAAPRS
jgi:ParB/RepB/Spo0J family partition protein